MRKSSGATRRYSAVSNDREWVAKGHAFAPPADDDNTGVSTSMKPRSIKYDRSVDKICVGSTGEPTAP